MNFESLIIESDCSEKISDLALLSWKTAFETCTSFALEACKTFPLRDVQLIKVVFLSTFRILLEVIVNTAPIKPLQLWKNEELIYIVDL